MKVIQLLYAVLPTGLSLSLVAGRKLQVATDQPTRRSRVIVRTSLKGDSRDVVEQASQRSTVDLCGIACIVRNGQKLAFQRKAERETLRETNHLYIYYKYLCH